MCLSSVLLNLTLSAILRTGGSSLVTFFVGGVCSGGKRGEHGAVKGSGELVLPLVCGERRDDLRKNKTGGYDKGVSFYSRFILLILSFSLILC